MSAAVKPAKVPQSSSGLLAMLRERYPNDSHVTLAEVRDAAGFDAARSCDALSLSTWPSRGLLLRGFEIKVTRSDWLREYRDATKADSFAVHCDEWYLVVADSSIVQADELPDAWGLLVARGQRLECTKPATKNANPVAVDRGLLVAMMKRAKEQGPTQKSLEAAREDGRQQAQREAQRQSQDVERLNADLANLRKLVADFETASGVRVGDTWNYNDGQRIGEAVRLVMHGGDRDVRQTCHYMLGQARHLVTTLEALAADPRESAVSAVGAAPVSEETPS